MCIDAFLQECEKQGFQPYYSCYWYYFNKPIGYFNNVDYIFWIDKHHKYFQETFNKPIYSKNYRNDFLEYLKNYVEERRNTYDSVSL